MEEVNSDKDTTDHKENKTDPGTSVTSENKNEDTEGRMDAFIEESPEASEEASSDQEETNVDMFISSTCSDEVSDCSIESATKDKEMDAVASTGASNQDEMEGHLKVLPDEVLSPTMGRWDKRGGKPPNDGGTNHQSKPVYGLYVTRRYIECWSNDLEVWQTVE
jgi:hypothetical protein